MVDLSSAEPRTALAAVGEGLAELTFDDAGGVGLGYGGDVANVCVMAARAGARSRLIGRVGADRLGHALLEYWSREGVDVIGVQVDEAAPTGLYLNEPAEDGHRFVYLRSGSAGSRLAPADVDGDLFDEVRFLVITGVTLAVSQSSAVAAAHATALARGSGARIVCVLNHRPALGGDIRRLADVAGDSDILIASSEDALAVFGTADPRELAEGPTEIVLTSGAAPVSALADGILWRQPVPSVPVRNAAGAGDALAGAYLAARLAGGTPQDALRLGVAASALSVQRDGCARSYPSGAEARAFANRIAVAQPVGGTRL